ncbi:hypothetical protein C5E06_00305 [Pseudoclavibacter sp. RFBI5]|uniref:hypothetical protein n=1 Tax=Pseudoclavibacter sp. RFBI5 TaxID=2080578 RepID=UPI000CE82091|nr:hypothetical protein [Pseudoclavibacter sp. RFBI5]PPG05854.1 hypothetical protein C5E06_00305 [Pseudoclavibacter sp. RFBI5]
MGRTRSRPSAPAAIDSGCSADWVETFPTVVIGPGTEPSVHSTAVAQRASQLARAVNPVGAGAVLRFVTENMVPTVSDWSCRPSSLYQESV